MANGKRLMAKEKFLVKRSGTGFLLLDRSKSRRDDVGFVDFTWKLVYKGKYAGATSETKSRPVQKGFVGFCL